jgi:hypothetical protein
MYLGANADFLHPGNAEAIPENGLPRSYSKQQLIRLGPEIPLRSIGTFLRYPKRYPGSSKWQEGPLPIQIR